jgi:NAD(P)H-hydrate epimerase
MNPTNAPLLPALSRDQVRRVDKIAIETYGVPGIVLMENAGRGAAEVIAKIAPPGEVVILCGRGNNAGDGYVIARQLQLHGRDVRIVSIVALDSLQGDADVNAQIAVKSQIPCVVVRQASELDDSIGKPSTLVECLLGTGSQGAPRDLYADAILSANRLAALRIAIDLPAGLDCDTGVAHSPTLRADHTISFVAEKIGFAKNEAHNHVGTVHVVGIGAPKRLLEQVKAELEATDRLDRP